MDEASARASGGGKAADVVDLYRKNPTQAVRLFGGEWGAWWRSKTGDKPAEEPWNASGRLKWKSGPVPLLLGLLGTRVEELDWCGLAA